MPCRKRASALNVEQTEASEAGGELGDFWVCAEGSANATASASAGSGGTGDARVGHVGDVEDTADDDVRSLPDAAVHRSLLPISLYTGAGVIDLPAAKYRPRQCYCKGWIRRHAAV